MGRDNVCRLCDKNGNGKGYWLPFIGQKRQWEEVLVAVYETKTAMGRGIGCRLWGKNGNGKTLK